MFRKALLTTAAAIAMFALSSVAHADPITLTSGVPTTLNFQSPNFAGSTSTATFTLNGNTLTVVLTNTSTNGTFLSGLGFDTNPNLTLTNATTATDGWTAGSGPGGGLGSFELVAFGNGNPNRLAQGESATATFVFSGPALQTLTLDQVIVHLTSLPNGNSEKVPGTPTHAPEPMTMLLFGSGLAGIAARARRRHRNANA